MGGPASARGVSVPRTKVNQTYLNGDIKLIEITGPDEGRNMTFTLRNEADKPLEDLTARVVFYLPATGIQAYDTDPQEVPFSLFGGEQIPIKVHPTRPGKVIGWKLFIQPAVTVAREGGFPGSMFLDRKLECVRIVDRLTAMKPSIVFTVRNNSEETVELLEYQVVIMKAGKSWNTGWVSIPDAIEAGAMIEIKPDVTGAPVGAVTVLLKIQQSVL
jgi:hypothetical protein